MELSRQRLNVVQIQDKDSEAKTFDDMGMLKLPQKQLISQLMHFTLRETKIL